MKPSTIERPAWCAVTGVVLLDKPLGLSSNHALQRVRRLYRAAKAGHTGTLDPLASGLLPLCLGEATKYSSWILDAPKGYRATLRLGITSDTGDAEGELTSATPFQGDKVQIEQVLQRFSGDQQQIPPMHSALKINGQTLYQLARRGTQVVRAARAIHVHTLTLIDWCAESITLEARVSKGTYIRVLAEDIGQALGCGAYLSALRRLSTGPFELIEAVTLDDLEQQTDEQRRAHLQSVDRLLAGVPALTLHQSQAAALGQGQVVAWHAPEPYEFYRIYDEAQRFYGLARAQPHGLMPVRMMGESWMKDNWV